MDKIENQVVSNEEAVKEAASKLEDNNLEAQIKELRDQIERQNKVIQDYQDINQKLFLKVANPVVTADQSDSIDPLVKSATEKINKYNKELETNGSNYQQGSTSFM